MVDESPATRLAVVLFGKELLTPAEFLEVIDPRSSYHEFRVRGEFDGDTP